MLNTEMLSCGWDLVLRQNRIEKKGLACYLSDTPLLFPKFLSVSFGDEHQAGGVGQVSQVQQQVDGGEHRHADLLGQIAAAPVLAVKRENGPEDDSRHVHDEGQEAIR